MSDLELEARNDSVNPPYFILNLPLYSTNQGQLPANAAIGIKTIQVTFRPTGESQNVTDTTCLPNFRQ